MTFCSKITCSNYLPCDLHLYARDKESVSISHLLHSAETSETVIMRLRQNSHPDHQPIFIRMQRVIDAIAQECPSEAENRCFMFTQKMVPVFYRLVRFENDFFRAINLILFHADGHIWDICTALIDIDWDYALILEETHPHLRTSPMFGMYVIHCCLAPLDRQTSSSNLVLAMKNSGEFEIVFLHAQYDGTIWSTRRKFVKKLFLESKKTIIQRWCVFFLSRMQMVPYTDKIMCFLKVLVFCKTINNCNNCGK